MQPQVGISKKKAMESSKTVKLNGLNWQMRLLDVLNAMLGFQPHELIEFKCGNKKFKLEAVFDSKDWNPKDARKAIFELSEASQD